MNLKNDIIRLAEMQYRKGFESGYNAAVNRAYSMEKVREWRFRGFKSGFRDNFCLNGAKVIDPVGALVAECKNCQLTEMANFLTKEESKNIIVVSEITETFDGLQITITGIENLSDNEIKRKITEAFRY